MVTEWNLLILVCTGNFINIFPVPIMYILLIRKCGQSGISPTMAGNSYYHAKDIYRKIKKHISYAFYVHFSDQEMWSVRYSSYYRGNVRKVLGVCPRRNSASHQ